MLMKIDHGLHRSAKMQAAALGTTLRAYIEGAIRARLLAEGAFRDGGASAPAAEVSFP